MGIIRSTVPQLWLNAGNGVLSYKLKDSDEYTIANGFVGIIRGVSTRHAVHQETGQTSIQIRLNMEDSADMSGNYGISGTLIDWSGNVTVFGKMLVGRLVHPDCLERKGLPVLLRVWKGETKDPQRTAPTCCTLIDPASEKPLNAEYLDKELSPDEQKKIILTWVDRAIDHYGSFDAPEPKSTQPAATHSDNRTPEPEAQQWTNDLPF